MINKRAQGKKNNLDGAAFELKVRKMFEGEGWIVSKYQNNINLDTDEIVMAKGYYIPGRGLTLGKGFPDFVMFRKIESINTYEESYDMQFVECKRNIKRLSKEEKQKLQVLHEQGHKCYIAHLKGKEIILKEFEGYDNS